LPTTLRAIAQEETVNPSQLELQLSEAHYIEHAPICGPLIAALRDDGFRIVLSDFGTGYSSLQCLRRFVVDKIKLDPSFVDLAARDQSLAIIPAAATLAHAMEIEVVADGISSAEEEKIAMEAGCDGFQGSFYTSAIPF
jgi:EAL domain-containing protein (putative c-di-GMP-specific phosphodiesterase class I)